jgi:hypothetical protein
MHSIHYFEAKNRAIFGATRQRCSRVRSTDVRWCHEMINLLRGFIRWLVSSDHIIIVVKVCANRNE